MLDRGILLESLLGEQFALLRMHPKLVLPFCSAELDTLGLYLNRSYLA